MMMSSTPRISAAALIDAIERTLPGRDIATRALHATLITLGERLTDDEAEGLAARLPRELSRLIDQSEYEGDFDGAELYRRASQHMHVELARSHEYVDVVLRALGRQLDLEERQNLMRILPEAIGRHLDAPAFGEPPPPHEQRPQRRRQQRRGKNENENQNTLASGRPGSLHPLATSAPKPTAQTHSVACSTNPHGEMKLSSAHGLTQDEE